MGALGDKITAALSDLDGKENRLEEEYRNQKKEITKRRILLTQAQGKVTPELESLLSALNVEVK
jgi:hypothetical protein